MIPEGAASWDVSNLPALFACPIPFHDHSRSIRAILLEFCLSTSRHTWHKVLGVKTSAPPRMKGYLDSVLRSASTLRLIRQV